MHIFKMALGISACYATVWAQEEDSTVEVPATVGAGSFWESATLYRPYPLATNHRPNPEERTVPTVRIARNIADDLLGAMNSGNPK